jgi:hypothetical protein
MLALAISASGLRDDIESGLRAERFYIGDGVEVTEAEMRSLVDAHPSFYFVALAAEVTEGPESLADDLLDVLGDGTVVILTPEEVGAVSSEFDDSDMDSAFDRAELGGSYADDFAAFAAALSADEQPADPVDSGGGSGWVPVIIGVTIVGLVGLFVWRGKRRAKESNEKLLTEAQTEIRQQMDVIATQIVELADDPRVEAKPEAQDHYRQASQTFQDAESRLAAANSLAALEKLSDDLDRARWQLDAADALIEGKALPPEPQPEAPIACFFDPTHGAGREPATIETSAGSKVVMVCEADAERLRRGQDPIPRQIPYGNQSVPAPQAPRSHGGLGMDWLDIFSVIVGGMGTGRSYDWSRTTRLPRPSRPGNPFPSRSRGSGWGSRSSSRGRGSGSRGRR